MLEAYFIEFGYTHENYLIIRESYSVRGYKDEVLIKKFQTITAFLLNNGYNKDEVIKLTTLLPSIYTLSIENMKQKMEDMISLGYSKEEVIKMSKALPSIYTLSIENIKQKIENMISLGYSKEEVIKMSKSCLTIYGHGIETIKQKVEDIISLGYSKEEAIKITKIIPSIYNYSIETIKQKVEDIISLGYSKEEVIKMTKSLPSLYTYSIENIKQKIDFYDSIDMHCLAVISPKDLMQSIALSYARYYFFLEKGIIININNYKKLFMSIKQFEKSYGITKEELLSRYNYKNDMENKNGRII